MRFDKRAIQRRTRSLHLNEVLRSPFGRLRLALLLGALLGAVGTAGYVLIDHYSLLDAVYMTIITLSTVGYGETEPLDSHGRIFTIVLILFGIGTAAWVFTTIIQVFVSEETITLIERRRMNRLVDTFDDHYIVCGFGRIGQEIAQGYTQSNVTFLVIEREPARLEMLRAQDIPFIEGDAADDDVLLRAGILRAAALIAVTPTDAINTFIVLSARGLSPTLYIVARADSMQNEDKLRRAGASKVVSPHILGGRWMGITAINPAVTDFVSAVTEADQTKFALREVIVAADSACAGMTVAGAQFKQKTGALVVALRPAAEARVFLPNPPDDRRLAVGDLVIAIGAPKQLQSLSRLLNPSQPAPLFPRGTQG